MNRYGKRISRILHGKTLAEEFREKRDWEGPGAIIDLYKTSGRDEKRAEFIDGIKQVISDTNETKQVRAQLIQIAESQNIEEVYPEVMDIKTKECPLDMDNPLHAAVNNYLISRKLQSLAPL